MHSTDHEEGLLPFNAYGCPGYGPGLLLKLSISVQDLLWITTREVWTARLRLYVVHEARSVQLIDWFDSFPKSPEDVRSWPTIIQTREVEFPGVIWRDVLDH